MWCTGGSPTPIPPISTGSAISPCSLGKIGDLQLGEGERSRSVEHLRGSACRSPARVAKSEPTNVIYQGDLSATLVRVGDADFAAGATADAEAAYQESLEINRRLSDLDPGNLVALRDTGLALERIAELKRDAGDLSRRAPRFVEESLAICPAEEPRPIRRTRTRSAIWRSA